MRCKRRTTAILTIALSLCWSAASAIAHDFTITATTATFRTDGTYQIDMTVDLDALLLGLPQSSDSAANAKLIWNMPDAERDGLISNLKSQILKRTRIRFDGTDATPEVSFPEYHATPSQHTENPAALGVTARMSGVVPLNAQTFTFWASRAFQAVHLTIRREASEGDQGSGIPGAPGQAGDRGTGNVEQPPSAALVGGTIDEQSKIQSRRAGTKSKIDSPSNGLGDTKHVLAVGEESPPYDLRGPVVAQSRFQVAFEYAKLGFTHILPKGIDHILFVLGLFLLSTKWKPLLWQVTAFTIAHSITLGLSIYDVIPLSEDFRGAVVEPLIALSIAYVAVENVLTKKLHFWRPMIVFAFGLLHGLGFAGVLSELGLPRSEFATALITFNVGVELGQLCVIGLAYLAVGWFRERRQYRAAVVIPASCCIAALGFYTAVQRALFPDWPSLI